MSTFPTNQEQDHPMTDPITAEDLQTLREIRDDYQTGDAPAPALLDRLIAHAESLQPKRVPDVPMVVETDLDGRQWIYWQEGGKISGARNPDGTLASPWTTDRPERYTAYVPTVTAAQIEAAVEAARAGDWVPSWECRQVIRAALPALGLREES